MKQPTPYMLALVVSVAFIEGCASLHPSLYARGDQDATIIVYIEGLFSQVPEGMQPSAVVSLDGVNIVKLLRGEYAQINCPPGTHQLAVFEDGTMGERLISFDVDAKERSTKYSCRYNRSKFR